VKKLYIFILYFSLSVVSFGQIKLIFRYDDFLLRKDSLNEKLVDLFILNKVPIVLGVIPADENEQLVLEKDYAYLPVLKNAEKEGGIEIALHGLNHSKLGAGEFGDVEYKEQYRRLSLGKHYLDSIFNQNTVTFIPPWNVYDSNTLSVLQKLNFNTISSALCNGQATNVSSLSYVPCTVEHPQELLSVLERNKNKDGIVVLMFHRYDFGEKYTLSDIKNVLLKVKSLDFVQVLTFKQLYENKNEISAKRFEANLESTFLKKELKLKGIIYSTQYLFLVKLLNLLLYTLIGILFCVTSFLICRKLSVHYSKKTIFVTVLILFTLLSLVVWLNMLSPLKMWVGVIVLSVILPFLICIVNEIVRK
jgi:hypothetical protein